tara:strand:+ start:1466 stop:2911 length:1446 start_codon:yes stop_codon:yes gene_type:complete
MSEIKVNKITPRTDCGTTTLGDSGDSITVGGDLKSNALKATDGGSIISQSGTTITIGASGDTVSLASGASQSGFGRSGSVDWQTGSIKTATFTAATGEGYFCNTSGGAFTVNLPAGSAGAIVAVADYTRTFNSNNLTISPNGSEKIGGIAADAKLTVNGQSATFVYVDGTEGWINVQNAEDTETGIPPAYIAATGGSITTVCTNFKVHTFTGPGTFAVTAGAGPIGVADYLVLAGGGGGTWDRGEGGGAGGYRESGGTSSGCYSVSPLGSSPSSVAALPFVAGCYSVTVGGGGAAGQNPSNYYGQKGSSSVLSTITSTGGGGGGSQPYGPGGSGGGAHGGGGAFGTGNTPPVTPPQGNPGGSSGPNTNAAGGGGAATAGSNATPGGGSGGDGASSSITGSSIQRGGGGGGSRGWCGSGCGSSGNGGGGGGGGAGGPGGSGTNGTANKGGGGGGAGNNPIPTGICGGTGGSGVVIIRYRFQA